MSKPGPKKHVDSVDESQNEISVDELLAKAKQIEKEMKEQYHKLGLIQREYSAIHVESNMNDFEPSVKETGKHNNLQTAVRTVKADDAKIAQFGAYTKQISERCDEMMRLMEQEMLEPSDSSEGGSLSVERLDSVSNSNDQETEDIL